MALMPHPFRGQPFRSDSGSARPRLWEAPGPSRLVEVLDEFTLRWERGESPRAEDYTDRLPAADPDGLVELIFHEFCLADSEGLKPDPADYLRRFPGQSERLGRLFDLRRALPTTSFNQPQHDDGPPVPLEADDEIGPYRLVRELGRGGFARVFLAKQTDLEDRLVVVKATIRPSLEPQLLARAPHAHIVPVLREATTAEGLQILCMPFLGGASLSAVLAERRRIGRRPATGLGLLADLDRVSAPEYPAAHIDRPAREILAGLSYPKAVAWIVARLAEALDHAHDKGVTHGDVKPSNVLLTADGQPMLLDLNLSTDWRAEDGGTSSRDAGGTLAYMAPERLSAIAEPATAAPARPIDRHWADLYALGLVLREALTGVPPWVPEDRPRSARQLAAVLNAARRNGQDGSRKLLSSIPPGLRPILRRCLAPAPGDRYRRGRELAEDLDRWRADRAPLHTEIPWWVEALRWSRRRRRALIAGALCMATGTFGSVGVALHANEKARGQAAAHASDLQERAQAWLTTLWDGSEPGVYSLGSLDRWLPRPDSDPVTTSLSLLSRLEAFGPGDWREREDVRALPERDRLDLELWVLEQGWRHGRAVLSADYDPFPEDRRRALEGLEHLAALAPSAPLDRLTRALRQVLDLPEATTPALPRDAHWSEPYLLGLEADLLDTTEAVALGLQGSSLGVPTAIRHYRDLLSARPDSYWAHYRMAAAATRLGLADEAAEHLDFCLARQPRSSVLHVLRATAYDIMGRPGAAVRASDEALRLAPGSEAALQTRVSLAARSPEPEPVDAHFARYKLQMRDRGHLPLRRLSLDAMLSPRQEEWLGLAREILHDDHEDLEVRFELATQLHRSGRRDEALEEYTRVLDASPSYLPARFNRAALLQEHKRYEEAVADYSRVLDDPRLGEFLERTDNKALLAFHLVAADRSRRGRYAEAIQLAGRGLEHAHRFGAWRAESHYALARACAAAAIEDPTLLSQAAAHLMKATAFDPENGDVCFQNDPIFDQFRPILQAAIGHGRSQK